MSVFVGGISKCDPQLSNAEPVIVAGKLAPASLSPCKPGLQACTGKPASPQAWV